MPERPRARALHPLAETISSDEVFRSVYYDLPDLRPIIFGVVDSRNIKPGLATDLANAGAWVLLYFFTPVMFKKRSAGDRWRQLPAHTAVLLSPGSRYSVDTRATPGLSHHVWMVVGGIETTSLFTRLLREVARPVLFRDPVGLLGQRMVQLVDLVESLKDQQPFWAMQWNGRKVLELAGAARIQSDDTFEVPSATAIPPPDLFVGRIVEYLHTHLADKVTLVQIAAHVHASPSTVSHRYRAFTGEPPIQTLKRMRILEAKIMMIRGHPLNEIVERLNFCDARHLALQFRRFEGMTPRQFRKQARGA